MTNEEWQFQRMLREMTNARHWNSGLWTGIMWAIVFDIWLAAGIYCIYLALS